MDAKDLYPLIDTMRLDVNHTDDGVRVFAPGFATIERKKLLDALGVVVTVSRYSPPIPRKTNATGAMLRDLLEVVHESNALAPDRDAPGIFEGTAMSDPKPRRIIRIKKV